MAIIKILDFTFDVDFGSNTASITKFEGTDSVLYLPNTLTLKNPQENVVEVKVNKIGPGAFTSCSSTLTELIIRKDNYYKSFIGGCFRGCVALKKFIHNDSLYLDDVRYGFEMFRGCTNLINVRLNPKVTNIPENMFYDCTALTHINFEELENLTSTQTYSFRNCVKLLDFPTTLTDIGTRSFYDCKSLSKIFLTNVSNLNYQCFGNCDSIKEVDIQFNNGGPNVIGIGIFNDCHSLSKVTLENNYTNSNTDNYDPNKHLVLSKYMFLYCYNLVNVKLPENGFVHIGSDCFNGCGFEYFPVPNNVLSIGFNAFHKSKLNKIELYFTGLTFYGLSEAQLAKWGVQIYDWQGKLKDVTDDDGNSMGYKELRYIYSNSTQLENVKIKSGLVWKGKDDIQYSYTGQYEYYTYSFFSDITTVQSLTLPSSTMQIHDLPPNLSDLYLDTPVDYIEWVNYWYNNDENPPSYNIGKPFNIHLKELQDWSKNRFHIRNLYWENNIINNLTPLYLGGKLFVECNGIETLVTHINVNDPKMDDKSYKYRWMSIKFYQEPSSNSKGEYTGEYIGGIFNGYKYLKSVKVFSSNTDNPTLITPFSLSNCASLNTLAFQRFYSNNEIKIYIHHRAFDDSSNISNIFYEGSGDEWGKYFAENTDSVSMSLRIPRFFINSDSVEKYLYIPDGVTFTTYCFPQLSTLFSQPIINLTPATNYQMVLENNQGILSFHKFKTQLLPTYAKDKDSNTYKKGLVWIRTSYTEEENGPIKYKYVQGIPWMRQEDNSYKVIESFG